MSKITIRVDAQTGGSYFPKEIRRAGFHGEIEGFLNLLTCLLVKPGATLTDVERSVKIILADVTLRKDGEKDMSAEVGDREDSKLHSRSAEVARGGVHPIFYKYTRAWLSRVTGYSRGYLCRVATGKLLVSQSFMKRACLALGEPEGALFLLEGEEEGPQP